MEKPYRVLFVDDDERYAKPLIDRASQYDLLFDYCDNWEEARSKLDDDFESYQAVILDGKGKLSKEGTGDNQKHVIQAINDLQEMKGKRKYIPYAVLSKYIEVKDIILGEIFEKDKDEVQMFEHLILEIEKSGTNKIRIKYPEPFTCFGEEYLSTEYETYLVNIIKVFENRELTDPENLLFNPCRVLLERVFDKITEVDEKILPYALANFERQRPVNCSKYLIGLTVTVDKVQYTGTKFLDDYISQQIQTIIAVCHPASHEIQKKYTHYTFKSVLWAIFDVLIWLKKFIDERK